MRISDWSSDVCSSDLLRLAGAFHDPGDVAELAAHFLHHRARGAAHGFHRHRAEQVGDQAADQQADDHHVVGQVECEHFARIVGRSEEHTSELQSLMRISYDVFCLKKKNKKVYT